MHSFLAALSASGPQLSLRGSFRAGCTKNVSASIRLCLVCFALCQSLQTPCQSVLFLYPEILYHFFGPPTTSVLHESCWQSINAKVASFVFCLLRISGGYHSLP